MERNGQKITRIGQPGLVGPPYCKDSTYQRGSNMTKIALITGANRGLGRQTALDIARQGGDVIVTYRGNIEQAEAVVADIHARGRKAIALPLDMA